MNQRAILHVIAAVIGIPVLITIGVWSATDPVYAGVSALIVLGTWVMTQLGQRCWLLIPFFTVFGGAMNVVPGHFSPRDIVIGLVAMILPAIWVVRRFPIRIRLGSIEIALLGLIALLGQAYLRNPTGLSVFGSANIGGRTYFAVGVSIVAFLILSTMVVDLKRVKFMVIASIAGSLTAVFYDVLLGVVPALAVYGAAVYNSSGSSSAIREYLGLGPDPSQGTGRMIYLKNYFRPITLFILANRSPMELLNPKNFLFLILLGSAGVSILLSGFRSGVAEFGLLIIAATLLHRKPIQLVFMGLVGAPLLAVILLLQGSVVEIPLAAQRALSFLPADWNQRAVREAQGSSDWRFMMWEEALTSDEYIRNKWIGDGFGFTAREMAYQQELIIKGLSETDQQEYFLTVGDYHSGPIEVIKRIGYLGLLFLLIVMGIFFKAGVRVVNRARGTPYYPYAMFLALPLVIHPFYFIFVFGTLKGTLGLFLLGGGALRLLENSFDVWVRQRSHSAVRQREQAGLLPAVGARTPA